MLEYGLGIILPVLAQGDFYWIRTEFIANITEICIAAVIPLRHQGTNQFFAYLGVIAQVKDRAVINAFFVERTPISGIKRRVGRLDAPVLVGAGPDPGALLVGALLIWFLEQEFFNFGLEPVIQERRFALSLERAFLVPVECFAYII